MRYYILFVLLFTRLVSFGQAGGNNTFEFLNLVNSARVAALGGATIAIKDEDLNLGTVNPSLLNASMSKQVTLNYVNYFADISYGFVGYTQHVDSVGTFMAGLQYINYGTFKAADETSRINGQFKAGEYAFHLAYARPIDSLWTIGADLKYITSSLEQYHSNGMAIDLAGSYYNPVKLFGATLMIKNIGYQFKPYYGDHREPLPFQVQAGISQKLKKAPLRFNLGLEDLQQFDLTYPNPDTVNVNLITSSTNDEPKKKGNFAFGDKLLRHTVLGAEILLSKNFHVRASYNYRRRQELKVTSRPAVTGFSFGAGIRIFKIHLSYAWASYHLGGVSNHFSLAVRFADFNSKK